MEDKKIPLVISEDVAKKQYATAIPELKIILEETFGKDFFKEKITDRVKDIYQAQSIYYKNMPVIGSEKAPVFVPVALVSKVEAYYNALIIANVLNEGWKPDFDNIKYYIYYSSDVKMFLVDYTYSYVHDTALMFKTQELAEYFINTFHDICNLLYK